MLNIISIIIVAILGVVGNIFYFEYRLRKEHKKKISKEQLTKLLLPLYMTIKTDELLFLKWRKNPDLDFCEYEADIPERLLNPIKDILDKNLYLADDELQRHSLEFIEWAYREDGETRFQDLHCGGLEQDKILNNFRELVYRKYDEQRRKYLNL